MAETVAENTVEVILFYHRSLTLPDRGHLYSVIFTLSEVHRREI